MKTDRTKNTHKGNGKKLRRLFILCVLTAVFGLQCAPLGNERGIWKTLPVQHKGRIKAFDSLARESLRTVYGKETFKRKPAFEIVLSWLLLPDYWESASFIFVEKEIKKSIGLPLKSKHFSPYKLKRSDRLILQWGELKDLRERKEALDPYFQKLEKLETRLLIYEAVRSGALIRLVPQDGEETWLSLREMGPSSLKAFQKILSLYVRAIAKNTETPPWEGGSAPALLKDSEPPPEESLKKAMARFQNGIFKGQEKKHFSPLKIKAESFYNSFNPFQKAWVFYLLFLATVLLFQIFGRLALFRWALPFGALGFICHSLGMALRSFIMSRPPVTNMYETVIWVPWMAWTVGFVLWLKGSRMSFTAGNFLGFFCLLLAGLSPGVLDPGLQPLTAVLNSSFWLTSHVLIITMSYSFFFLSFVLGDMALVFYLSKRQRALSFAEKISRPVYRSLQWGIALLAGGIILGGIWADYSWGRFWGWDPKESWALVSLLCYLALLHARLSGKIKAFGLSVGAVMMFFSVIMAWYGVNFVLGKGLHSYGFGSGGLAYVLGFAGLHVVLCALALFKRQGLWPFPQTKP